MKVMDVEKALVWAYREELPKSPRVRPAGMMAPWRAVTSFGELLQVVDDDDLNDWGVTPDPMATSWPDPDAILIHLAVGRLDDLDLCLPDDWNPLGDCDMGAEAGPAVARGLRRLYHVDSAGRPRLRQMPRILVQRCAILGAPEWRGDKPVRREVREHGRARWYRRTVIDIGGAPQEIEVDGFDHRRRRPYADAYRKHEWTPDPAELALDRAVYEVWRAALDVLVEDLAGQLQGVKVTASTRPWRPWEDGEHQPRVLADMRPPPPKPAPVKRRRARRFVST